MLRRSQNGQVPARVDLAGGWLDVPSKADPRGFIVNCAITPFAHPDGPYAPGSGVGGSAAVAVFEGKRAIETELAWGAGWQDPAIIQETGGTPDRCPAWRSSGMARSCGAGCFWCLVQGNTARRTWWSIPGTTMALSPLAAWRIRPSA
jgi:hypothetical protein